MVSQSRLPYSPDLAVLTVRAVDLMWNVYPGYSADRLEKAELIPSVRGNLALAVEVLRRDQAPSYRELVDGRALGSRRASQSVPLESVIQAYRSTERVILLDLFSDSREWPVHQASHYADLVISTFDLLTDEMINSYRETSSAMDAARRRAENEIVNSLATGYPVNAAEFEQWSRILEVDTSAPWFAFALLAEEAADQLDLQRLRRRLAAQLQPHVVQILFGDVGRATVAVVSPRTTAPETKRILGSALSTMDSTTRIFCGTGQPGHNLAAAAESCRQAMEAARAAAAHHAGRAAGAHNGGRAARAHNGGRDASTPSGGRGTSAHNGGREASTHDGGRSASADKGARGSSADTGARGSSADTGGRGSSAHAGDRGAPPHHDGRGAPAHVGDPGASAHADGRGASVLDYEDALVEILLSGTPAAADSLVASRIAPLAGRPHLLETLEALIANDLSQSRVARALFVHVNTVNHRVKRIRELTGKDPMKMPDALEMALALRWQKLTPP